LCASPGLQATSDSGEFARLCFARLPVRDSTLLLAEVRSALRCPLQNLVALPATAQSNREAPALVAVDVGGVSGSFPIAELSRVAAGVFVRGFVTRVNLTPLLHYHQLVSSGGANQ